MKTVTILMCLLAISLAGCYEEMTMWGWDEDGAIGVRAGMFLTENNETGFSAKLRDGDSELQTLGIYAVHHFPDLVEFRNPFADIVSFLPPTLSGAAYFGGKIDHDVQVNTTETNLIAGVILEDTVFFETSQNGDSLVGLRCIFKF
jgi:hypothetical protein